MAPNQLFLSLTSLGLLSRLALSQSPGPDWPNCAASSRGSAGPWGWEIQRFGYQPQMGRGSGKSSNAVLNLELLNIADGSRVICVVSAVPSAAAGSPSAVLTNTPGDGQCETVWMKPHDQVTISQTRREPSALVSYDPSTNILSVNQTWACRETDGRLYVFFDPSV